MDKVPLIEHKITTSKDGRYILHKTIITHIMPSDYYRAVLSNAIKVTEEDLSDEEITRIVAEGRKYLKKL
jgi:hypothetical protein